MFVLLRTKKSFCNLTSGTGFVLALTLIFIMNLKQTRHGHNRKKKDFLDQQEKKLSN